MVFNDVGTRQTNMTGWCEKLNYPKKKQQARTSHGTFKVVVAKVDPGLVFFM